MSVRDIVMSAAGQGGENLYVEDVFQTWLRTGTGADVTVTNNVDMTEGYMLWTKGRSGATNHAVYDSERGVTKDLVTNSTAAETTQPAGLKAVSSTGYTIGSLAKMNTSGATYADWVFRKAPKFFDVVTYTGNGVAGRTVAHNLGSVPGMIIVKATSRSGAWLTYHRSLGATQNLKLNLSDSASTLTEFWNDTEPTSAEFSVGTNINVNENGASYVAYLFAHDAGGFGDTGTDSVVACGSYTGTGSAGNNVTLGWEPQFVLIKKTNEAEDWNMVDMMRGIPVNDVQQQLRPNSSGAESAAGVFASPTATGFEVGTNVNDNTDTYIYLAIRRPMKTPESGTEVFGPVARTGTGTAPIVIPTNFAVDFSVTKNESAGWQWLFTDRLRGGSVYLASNSTSFEQTNYLGFDEQNGVRFTSVTNAINGSGQNYVDYYFRRAPGFFDVVCYTGTGVARTVNHNLGVAPEMMIVKTRSGSGLGWYVYSTGLGPNKVNQLNQDAGQFTSTSYWNNTAPTNSVFTLGNNVGTNGSGNTQVAYLFATLPGISKVGSYTGTGTTQDINCGFTTGARFVLIKRTDSTGDWYVWDTARGIVSGNDPYLLMNSNAGDITTTDYIDPLASGFQISSTAPAAINASGGSFIFLAIA